MFKLSLGHKKFLLFPQQKCILYFNANYKLDRTARDSYVNLDIVVARVLTNTRKSSTENGHFGRDKVTSHFLYGDNIDPGGISFQSLRYIMEPVPGMAISFACS